MWMMFEGSGLSPVGFNSIPATDPEKPRAAERIGRLALDVLEDDRRPSKILPRRAFDNAIAAVAASRGSTNAARPLLPPARGVAADPAIHATHLFPRPHP